MFIKKKSILKELWKDCKYFFEIFAFIVSLLLSYCIGSILPQWIYDDLQIKSFFGMLIIRTLIGFLLLSMFLLATLIVVFLITVVKTQITHIKAIINFCYLPYTTEEITTAMHKKLFSTIPELFDYICKKINYYQTDGTCTYKTLLYDDFYNLLKSCTEVWEDYKTCSFNVPLAFETVISSKIILVNCKIIEFSPISDPDCFILRIKLSSDKTPDYLIDGKYILSPNGTLTKF